jgi:hypothetical protein
MLDPHLQERFARRCADAAFGYQAASTAAYAAFSEQVLNFWSDVLKTPREEAQHWKWPVPSTAPQATAAPFNPFAAFAFPWMTPPQPKAPAPPSNPWEAMLAFANAMTSAMVPPSASTSVGTATGNPFANAFANPMLAWWSMFPTATQSAAWPMACMMMSSGVPHAVAWPTAEANAAVMDAADAATQSIKQVMASYRTDGGHGTASVAVWPHESMLTFAALVPLNISTMLAAMRSG